MRNKVSRSQADIEASYLEEEKKEEEKECKNAVENIRFPEEGGERKREREREREIERK